jgi:hypothetical protein
MPNGCPVTESVIRICHFYPAVASPVGKYAQIKTHLVQTRQSQDASTVPIRSGDTEAARSLGCKPGWIQWVSEQREAPGSPNYRSPEYRVYVTMLSLCLTAMD